MVLVYWTKKEVMGEERRDEGWENVFDMYYMKEESIFNKNIKKVTDTYQIHNLS